MSPANVTSVPQFWGDRCAQLGGSLGAEGRSGTAGEVGGRGRGMSWARRHEGPRQAAAEPERGGAGGYLGDTAELNFARCERVREAFSLLTPHLFSLFCCFVCLGYQGTQFTLVDSFELPFPLAPTRATVPPR